MEKYAIIVAGGQGLRMGTVLPKQFLTLGDKPILMHSIEIFSQTADSIIVALPSQEIDFWKKLCSEHRFEIEHSIVEGGETRFHSVSNALAKVPEGVLVGIHDAVRPLLSLETIERCYQRAAATGSAVPFLPITDSLRKLEDGTSIAIDRSQYVSVQTPQIFQSSLLKKAYQQQFQSIFTDDASVYESIYEAPTLVEGNPENIKITQPCDLLIAEALLDSIRNA